ncbi:hypothetical protein ABGB17_19405 [Sphaerisporangium sp. B11E5]|uniref:hypothetical protein n=1 Tax=Sphaerisporangium sp. B11E5 TaxID=3153563 RepID=UPI00325F8803
MGWGRLREEDAISIRLRIRRRGRGSGRPFAIACSDDKVSAQELERYEEALHAVGYRVEVDPDDDQVLRVWPIA